MQENQLNELFQLIVDTLTSRKKTFRIAKEDLPAHVVKNAFLRLDSDHIEYIIESLKKNTSKVKNIKPYLLTTLFNASKTYHSHLNLNVQNDLFEFYH